MIRKGIIVTRDGLRILGGQGSGNFGHAGVPGERGGSSSGGGGGGDSTKTVKTAYGDRDHTGPDFGYDFSELSVGKDEHTQGFVVDVGGMPKITKAKLESGILSEVLSDSIFLNKSGDTVEFGFIHVALREKDLSLSDDYKKAQTEWKEYFNEKYPGAKFTFK